MSNEHRNAAQQDVIDQVQNPAVRQAMEAALEAAEAEAENISEPELDTSDSYATFAAKSAAQRDRLVTEWETRARTSLAKRRAKFVQVREARHQARLAEWALAHDSAKLNPADVAGLTETLEARMAAEEDRIAEMRVQLAKLAAMAAPASTVEDIAV